MRLIDADVLIHNLKEYKIPFNADINEAIITAPTVDAIKVTRCNDCIYAKFDKYGISCTSEYGLFRDVAENDFCSWGSGYDT